MKRYKIKYKVETGEFEGETIKSEGCGGADELLICQIVSENKMSSILWTSKDGKTGTEISQKRLFDAWVTLTHLLASQDDLNNLHRELVLQARNSILASRSNGAVSAAEVARG